MFEGPHAPPFYNDLYNFKDGAQDDIFQGYYHSIPEPGPDQTALPVRAVARRDVPVERGTESSFAHRALGMTRRRKRMLNKADSWKPF